MTKFLFVLFTVECGLLLLWGLFRRGRVCELPFLAAGVVTGVAWVQLVGLFQEGDQTDGGLNRTFLMCILCLGMTYVGWIWPRSPMRAFQTQLDYRKVFHGTVALSAMGFIFSQLLGALPEHMKGSSGWTGLPVAYLFFAEAANLGAAGAFLLYFKLRSKPALVIACLSLLNPITSAILYGRRSPTAEVFLILLCSLWFGKKFTLPRWAVVACLLGGVFWFHGITGYRVYQGLRAEQGLSLVTTEASDYRELTQVLESQLEKTLQEGGAEMRHAVTIIDYTSRNGGYDYGAFNWNNFVFRFFPAQMFGRTLKDRLEISIEEVDYKLVSPYTIPPGTATTGFASAFTSFGYAGCLVFFCAAVIMRRIYIGAVNDNFAAQVIYANLIIGALHNFPHHTNYFFARMVYMTIFLLPLYWYARIPVATRVVRANRARAKR